MTSYWWRLSRWFSGSISIIISILHSRARGIYLYRPFGSLTPAGWSRSPFPVWEAASCESLPGCLLRLNCKEATPGLTRWAVHHPLFGIHFEPTWPWWHPLMSGESSPLLAYDFWMHQCPRRGSSSHYPRQPSLALFGDSSCLYLC